MTKYEEIFAYHKDEELERDIAIAISLINRIAIKYSNISFLDFYKKILYVFKRFKSREELEDYVSNVLSKTRRT